ncbi:MAG: sulfatase-like hydrolase/transferase [Terriglobia bacterium]|jgi:arylsulfatase A-like enzyme/Flp pilus assembly protein TadD
MDLGRGGKRLGWIAGSVVVLVALLVVVLTRLRPLVRFRSASAPTPAAGPPVLLITIDTLRADHVGCYGYADVQTPAIDFLAAQGVRFDDALAQVPLTLPSHASILSGTYPMWNGARGHNFIMLRADMGLMAEAFERQGYKTAAFVSSVVLDRSWGLSRGFATYDDRPDPRLDASPTTSRYIERRAEDTIRHLLVWFKANDPRAEGAKPFFVWLHLYDPHYPYDPPEPFHTQYASHLYDGEIAYTDSQLGRLFDYLREIGVYDRALIVLLSDHGESLQEHGEEEHGYFIYRSTLHVPLIIKLPVSRRAEVEAGRVVQTPVGLVDLAPTLLDLMHFRDPLRQQLQGSSLVSLVLGKPVVGERPIYSESYYARDIFGWSPLRSLSTGRYQYIAAPRPELYDTLRDPSEKQNVYGQHSADATTLRGQLLDVERRYTSQAASAVNAGPPISQDTVEKLKALGYLAFAAPAPSAPDDRLPDPKDHLATNAALVKADRLGSTGQFARAEAVLKSLRAKEPGLFYISYALGKNAENRQRWGDAEREYRACLKQNPSFFPAIAGLANAAKQEGKPDEARKWLEVSLSQYPQSYAAYYELGILAQSAFQMDEAQRDFEKAVALNQDFAPAQQQLGIILVTAGRYNAAIQPLEKAASLESSDPMLFNALGTAYLSTNQPQKAIQACRKALAINPDLAPARLTLALAYLRAGDRSNAITEFRTVCPRGGPQCEQVERLFR